MHVKLHSNGIPVYSDQAIGFGAISLGFEIHSSLLDTCITSSYEDRNREAVDPLSC